MKNKVNSDQKFHFRYFHKPKMELIIGDFSKINKLTKSSKRVSDLENAYNGENLPIFDKKQDERNENIKKWIEKH
jgi:hypothetical protein